MDTGDDGRKTGKFVANPRQQECEFAIPACPHRFAICVQHIRSAGVALRPGSAHAITCAAANTSAKTITATLLNDITTAPATIRYVGCGSRKKVTEAQGISRKMQRPCTRPAALMNRIVAARYLCVIRTIATTISTIKPTTITCREYTSSNIRPLA